MVGTLLSESPLEFGFGFPPGQVEGLGYLVEDLEDFKELLSREGSFSFFDVGKPRLGHSELAGEVVLGHAALLAQLANFQADMFSEFGFPGLFHHIPNGSIKMLINL